jgi:integral membrane protein
MLNTPLARLRAIGLVEGVSFLVLLLIAMPLKYLAGQPLAVKYVGWAHGVLFVLYLLAVLETWISRRWPFGRAFPRRRRLGRPPRPVLPGLAGPEKEEEADRTSPDA